MSRDRQFQGAMPSTLATKGGTGGAGGGVAFTPTVDMMMFGYFAFMALALLGVIVMLISMSIEHDDEEQ